MKEILSDHTPRKQHQITSTLSDGGVIVYPTDTVYGIGCDASNKEAVARVRQAKQRPEKPLSVIAPSQDWIRNHFDLSDKAETALGKLPGPFTYILSRSSDAVAPNVAPGKDSLGVRRPDHWITGLVSDLGKPVVTTSANISGEPTIETINDLSPEVTKHVDIAINGGRIEGSASTIIDYTGTDPQRIR
jgi:tRNA threonylcarbamoyl adenosine modification protein (Sua5/YciO/YrdC/YwlC family)